MGDFFRRVEHTIYNEYAKEDIRIAAISDLHYSHIVKNKTLEDIISKLDSLNPNYITIAGDLIDCIEVVQVPELRDNIINFLKSISAIAPVIISIGNHDFYTKGGEKWIFGWDGSFWSEVASIPNITIVDNSIYQDDKIVMFGYTQSFDFYFNDPREDIPVMLDELRTLKEDLLKPSVSLPKICLIHSPYSLTDERVSNYFKSYDIFLCGHMHEGLIPPILDEIIKSNYGLIAPSKFFFPKNARGTIELEDGKIIIISGGITKFCEAAPKVLHPFNFFYPMAIDDIILTCDNERKEYKKKIKYER